MPLPPITVTLSPGQQVEALKRFYQKYRDELVTVEKELTETLNGLAECEFLRKYLGEQPEVVALQGDQAKADRLEKRRQHLGMLLERLEQVIPKQGRNATAPAVIQRF